MFLLMPLIGAVVSLVKMVIKVVIAVVIASIKIAIHVAFATYRYFKSNNTGESYFELVAMRHFDWLRAVRNQDEADQKKAELLQSLEDNDGNLIPDVYDTDITSPAADLLHIKYPERMLVQNDYIRWLPRAGTPYRAPVSVGAKGIVRSEETLLKGVGGGQFVTVKWNAHHTFSRVNALDVNLIGHVKNSLR